MALNQSTYTLDYDQESTAMFGYENSMGGSVMSLNTSKWPIVYFQ